MAFLDINQDINSVALTGTANIYLNNIYIYIICSYT